MCQNCSMINETLQSCIMKNCSTEKGISNAVFLIISFFLGLHLFFNLHKIISLILGPRHIEWQKFLFLVDYLKVTFTGFFLPNSNHFMTNFFQIKKLLLDISNDYYKISRVLLSKNFKN